ncbi:hypothetical protein [Oceanicella sp. SM1341]|uniref:hypothetical protein n=1 Tax=Oceanicella sp. SM1341 TaxID=1548889 RepID=UPI000E553462|nr:hypothetical protein [Oceanicella sp. SM1341]
MKIGEPSARVAGLIHDGMMHAHGGFTVAAEVVFEAADRVALEAEHRLSVELHTIARMRAEIARHRAGLREGR